MVWFRLEIYYLQAMENFWDYTFNDDVGFIETYDELPLWSAPFGLFLLEHIGLQQGMTVMDIGSGTGFPLFELAERLGPSSKCYGLDPWKNANERAMKKLRNYAVKNVEVIDGSAEKIPMDDMSVDLIVSNLGINNFDKPDIVFTECHRVMKANGKLALTTNLNGHWKTFYDIFEETLRRLKKDDSIEKLTAQQWHRGTVATVSALFSNNGFTVTRTVEDSFNMRFLNGTAFLNHHFVKLGWLASWKNIIPENEWAIVFTELEKALNVFAESSGGLSLTVPIAFIEGQKI